LAGLAYNILLTNVTLLPVWLPILRLHDPVSRTRRSWYSYCDWSSLRRCVLNSTVDVFATRFPGPAGIGTRAVTAPRCAVCVNLFMRYLLVAHFSTLLLCTSLSWLRAVLSSFMMPTTLSGVILFTTSQTHVSWRHWYQASHEKTACSALSGLVPHSAYSSVLRLPYFFRYW